MRFKINCMVFLFASQTRIVGKYFANAELEKITIKFVPIKLSMYFFRIVYIVIFFSYVETIT